MVSTSGRRSNGLGTRSAGNLCVVSSDAGPIRCVNRHGSASGGGSAICGASRPVSRSSSTKDRIDIHVSSTPAYVQKEGRYVPGIGRGGHGRNRIRVNIHISAGGGSGSRRGAVGGTHSHIRGGGSGQGCGGGCGRRCGVVGRGRRHHLEVGGRVAASTSSSMGSVAGAGSDPWSLVGCAGHGKGTTVGDGGDGLARSKGWRFSLCHLRMVSTGGRRQTRPLVGSVVSRRGTTVGDGGDGLVKSKG